MKELKKNELIETDGGVPMSWYMDDDTIKANGAAITTVAPVYGAVIKEFWKEIVLFFI